MKRKVIYSIVLALGLVLTVFVAQAQGPTLDPNFAVVSAVGNTAPTFPQIFDMVRQPDGKLIVAGDFTSINNTPAVNLCRLLPDGQVDATFSTGGITNGVVISLVLQADGKLLVGGSFRTLGGQPRKGLARLLPDGTLDPGFISSLSGTPTTPGRIQKVAVQPGLGVLVAGTLVPTGSPGPGTLNLARLTEATGALDPTFQPGFDTFLTTDALVLPNGRLVFAGQPRLIGGQQCNVWGTLPNGALDPAFVPLPASTPSADARDLVRDPATGNLYVVLPEPGNMFLSRPFRLLPNGVPDPAFNSAGAFGGTGRSYAVASVAVQPNGRLLLGGSFEMGSNSYVGSWRLLPDGTRDFSYQPENGPSEGSNKVLVQPDGKLVFSGSFNQAGGFALNCLARMLDPNVLANSKQQAEAGTAAWPVPAHDVLYLRLAAGSGGPLRVALLDVLGRTVREQQVAVGQQALTLPLAGLPAGCYLLRVAYPSGPVLRRVVVE